MAKKPTADVKNADGGAPSQPWAQGAAKADASKAPDDAANAPAPAPAPTGDAEQSSEARDKVTPTGPSPDEVNEAAAALTPETSPNSVDAEAKDQVTESGEDVAAIIGNIEDADVSDDEAHREAFAALSDDDQAEFVAFMREQASLKLKQLARSAEARAMEVNLIDSAEHFGNRRSDARQKHLEA